MVFYSSSIESPGRKRTKVSSLWRFGEFHKYSWCIQLLAIGQSPLVYESAQIKFVHKMMKSVQLRWIKNQLEAYYQPHLLQFFMKGCSSKWIALQQSRKRRMSHDKDSPLIIFKSKQMVDVGNCVGKRQ